MMSIEFSSGVLPGYAAPLMPLHRRDRIILKGWFDRGDMGDIHSDVMYHLSQLVPEPCWDDGIYDFLHDYL